MSYGSWVPLLEEGTDLGDSIGDRTVANEDEFGDGRGIRGPRQLVVHDELESGEREEKREIQGNPDIQTFRGNNVPKK